MDEKIKNKDAEPTKDRMPDATSELEEGLEGTFPASDPASSTAPGSERNNPDKPGN